MKIILKILALSVLLIGFSACSDDEDVPVVPTLDVNYANLNGVWSLTEWNGNPMDGEIYCYIVFDRRNHTFKLYQKFDSMYARCITGEFQLEEDDDWGFVISGTYDYGMGDWNHEYIISDLLATGSMTWTVKGDDTDVCIYTRCAEVPAEVIAEAKVEE
jgi:hypothetical protein